MCQLVRDMIVHVRIGIINDLAALEPDVAESKT
jgi:hypothetical protein